MQCIECRGKGWIVRKDWPTECEACTPTKIVKGKVTLDAKRQAAILQPSPPKPVPVYTPTKARYQGDGTVSYDLD